jgi:hypothetical protein
VIPRYNVSRISRFIPGNIFCQLNPLFFCFPGQFLRASAKPASQLRGGSAARQEALLRKMISNQLFSSLYVLNAGAINLRSFELRISFFPNFWRGFKPPINFERFRACPFLFSTTNGRRHPTRRHQLRLVERADFFVAAVFL